MGWIAINSENTGKIVRAIGVRKKQRANWRAGLETVHDPVRGANKVFISPPLNGWTFIIGTAIPFPTDARLIDNCTPIITGLGDRFEDVQYYFADEELGFFAWARLRNGKIGRALCLALA